VLPSVGDTNAFAGICILSEYFPSSIVYLVYDLLCKGKRKWSFDSSCPMVSSIIKSLRCKIGT